MKSTKNTYLVRSMTRTELDEIAIPWALKEGWNPGLHDTEAFFRADPTGFYVGLLDDEPVACISVVRYNQTFAFLGFYIVKPEFRGRGYGLKLWKEALKNSSGLNIGLDGVLAQQENYAKSGFQFQFSNIRFEGRSKQASAPIQGIVSSGQISEEVLLAYDIKCFPCERTAFLRQWISAPGSMMFGVKREEKLAGYAVIRKCYTGYKIGPLFADDLEAADMLLSACSHSIPADSQFFVDIPEVNTHARPLIEKYHLKSVFQTARMYTKGPAMDDISKIYGVTSFELG